MLLLSRAKPSELQSPKAVTVGNVNKTDNRKDYVDNSQKKTEKHLKNVSDNTKEADGENLKKNGKIFQNCL